MQLIFTFFNMSYKWTFTQSLNHVIFEDCNSICYRVCYRVCYFLLSIFDNTFTYTSDFLDYSGYCYGWILFLPRLSGIWISSLQLQSRILVVSDIDKMLNQCHRRNYIVHIKNSIKPRHPDFEIGQIVYINC